MSIELVTGHAGSAHVTSAQDGRLNAAAWGTGKYVLPLQSQFAITVDSANQVTVATGDVLLEGRHITSEAPTTLTVDSGTQGMKRNDLVCIVYSKDNDGVESATMQVVKGTESSGTPSDPAIPTGSILAGDTECAMALWRLPIDGITLGTPVQLFDVADELSANENATYTLGYTNSTRVISLTAGGSGGAASSATLPVASSSTFGLVKTGSGITNSSGTISVSVANSSTSGLMPSSVFKGMKSIASGLMGFGYINASGTWYLYFPVSAIGFTSVSLARMDELTVTVDGSAITPTLGVISAALRNNGALLEISSTGTASDTHNYARKPCLVWCSHLVAVFS